MASKEQERFFLDRLIEDLGWTGARVVPGAEPPDFVVERDRSRIAVEVTLVFKRESRKGSRHAALESELQRHVSQLRDRYYAEPDRQPLQVLVGFPPIIDSQAVRRFTPKDRRADLSAVMERALARLRYLPRLAPGEPRRFQVRQRDGRPVTFFVTGLQLGAGEIKSRWRSANTTVGWVGTLDAARLQAKVHAKSADLPRYRANFESAILLVGAGHRASSYLELAPGALVHPEGFDAVYFHRYPDRSVLVSEQAPLAED